MNSNFKVYVPAKISGFFQAIYKSKYSNKILFGSRGAGPNLELGGLTSIEIINDNDGIIKIFINDKEEKNPITSLNVLKLLLPKNFKSSLNIYHNFSIPIGCGYGASGIGALGLSIALNKILNLGLTALGAGKIAHEAEIISRTGLGTVGPQLFGGLCITKKGGPPGKSVIDKILYSLDKIVITATFGQIETKKILNDNNLISKINFYGKKSMRELYSLPSVNNFLNVSKIFAENTNLISLRLKEVIEELNKINKVKASMCMLGESVFTIINKDMIKKITDTLYSYFNKEQIFISKINNSGALIL